MKLEVFFSIIVPMWIYWTLFGLSLIIAETLFSSGFYLFVIGLASIVTGVTLRYVDLQDAVYPVFFIIGLVLNFSIRKPLTGLLFKSKKFPSEFENSIVKIEEDLEPNESTKVEYRGTSWTARNIGETIIKSGTEVKVQGINGLSLEIKGE